MRIGFDNDKYLKMQSEHIKERIAQFDNKLYLEFGGKLFDDFHASRVLPGFMPDSKLNMLLQLKEFLLLSFKLNQSIINKKLPIFWQLFLLHFFLIRVVSTLSTSTYSPVFLFNFSMGKPFLDFLFCMLRF